MQDEQGNGSESTRFKPGQSGNPGGRPKGFATRIKELCGDDYDKIAKALYLIALGSQKEREAFFGEGEVKTVSTKDRIAALVALRDSGPGKPAQTLEHRGNALQPRRVEYVMPTVNDQAAGAEDEDNESEAGAA